MPGQKIIAPQTGNTPGFRELKTPQVTADVPVAGDIAALNTGGKYSTDVLPVVVTSAGAGSAGLIPVLDGAGRVDASILPVGIGADTASIQASEALAAGDYVNVWDSAGAVRVRKADGSSSGKMAHGFVIGAVASGANATVYFEGTNTAVTGMVGGAVWLSATTAGLGTATRPAAAGNVAQCVGFATTATSVNFQANLPTVIA